MTRTINSGDSWGKVFLITLGLKGRLVVLQGFLQSPWMIKEKSKNLGEQEPDLSVRPSQQRPDGPCHVVKRQLPCRESAWPSATSCFPAFEKGREFEGSSSIPFHRGWPRKIEMNMCSQNPWLSFHILHPND